MKGIRGSRIITIYALAIGFSIGMGLAASTAHAQERPDMGTAARLAQPDSILFCINESKTALDVASYVLKHRITWKSVV